MALDIPLDLHDTGLPARYWRITQTHLDHTQGQVTVWLHGWRDAAARLEGRTAAGAMTLILHASDLPEGNLHKATTGALYEALMDRAVAAAASIDPRLERAIGSIGHAILATASDC
jgi:hypothetical protein